MTRDYFRGDKIVSIRPFRQQALFPALGQLEAYWEGLRDGRLLPTRSEVDPRGIASVLEFAFVLEKIAPGLARIRLAGMHLNELMAMEVRGMPVTAMFLPAARREMQQVLETVLDMPAAVRLSLSGDTGLTRRPLEGQMMLLPMRSDDGAPTRILGALQTRGEIGRGPRRFSIRDVETKPVLVAPRPGNAPPEMTRPEPSTHARDLERQIDRLDRESEAAKARSRHLRLVYDADTLA